MRQGRMSRVLAAIFIGMLFGAYRHFRQVQWLGRGRDAFLADQSRYFNQIMTAHSATVTLVAGVILALVAVGLYEAMALGFGKLIPAVEVEE
jgi:hypothetical protein